MRVLVLVFCCIAPLAASAQSLRDAVESAWRRQPEALAAGARSGVFDARSFAAGSALPAPPTVSLGHRTDQLNRNQGAREYEIGVDLPIWAAGARRATRGVIDAERERFRFDLDVARLRIAGEVREAYWQARIAGNELALFERRAAEADRLALDVERRVRAGESAQVDAHQARAVFEQARAVAAEAAARAHRAERQFIALTGVEALPSFEQAYERPAAAGAAAPESSVMKQPAAAQPVQEAAAEIERHPLTAAALRAADAARARLGQAREVLRDSPELAIGMRRDRSAFGGVFDTTVSVGVRVPLATDARNRPRIAEASAELTETEARLPLLRARLQAELDSARKDLEQERVALDRAGRRLKLSAEAQAWIARAFDAGQIDLPARLRAENERFDAELAVARARLAEALAAARLNQSLGVLP